ncbi:AAA family ATPase [Nocardioides sp. W7]|uniref:AAA family ATPase n=1 Tax=Nocardioides sp. W7 TaxID=2931390 RepID=UPI001FD545A1|nr:AAA family ATPase [Nocardioides sp. W7]
MLHGEGIIDVVFHDMFHGCVVVPRSVELWAGQEWADGDSAPLIVRLTNTGDLDFGGNADQEAARQAFDLRRNPRGPRFASRRPTRRTGAAEQTPLTPEQEEEAREAADQAADGVADGLGSGRGLLNRMEQVAAALEAQGHGRMLVVVDDLAGQLEELQALGQDGMRLQVINCLKRRWLTRINPNEALVVHLDRDRALAPLLNGVAGVAWWPVGGPSAGEIGEALVRLDARHRIGLENVSAVSDALAHHGSLRESLGAASRTYQARGRIDPAGVLDLPDIDEEAIATVLGELDQMVGLEDLKAKLRDKRDGAVKLRERVGAGKPDDLRTMHMIFRGGAGTGKTTAAKIVARLFHALGLLSTDWVVETTANDIVSQFQGASRERMVAKIAEARNGVLFIDEAHQFADQSNSHVQEALQALVPLAWDNRHNMVIILAGYAPGMADLLATDEGLERRFPVDGRIEFHDYNRDELWEILSRQLRKQGLRVEPGTEATLRRVLVSRSQRSGFGNAGGVGNLVGEILDIRDARPDADPDVVTSRDMPPRVRRRPEELAQARAALDQMIGLSSVKDAVADVVANLLYIELEDEDIPGAPRYRFVGPPGTGKTTVARLMGQMLYGAGLLDRKQVVEVKGADLMAPYVGQTAPRVRKMFVDARGGVLFIDEAHALIPRGEGTFARDALSAVAAELTHPDNRDTVLILAGYPGEIDQLIQAEPGLARRVPSVIPFEALTPAECVEKARFMVGAGDRPHTAEPLFYSALEELVLEAQQNPNFGSAGWVENIVGGAISQLRRRVAADPVAYDAPGRRHLLVEDLGLVRPTEQPVREVTVAVDLAAEPSLAPRIPIRLDSFIPHAPVLPRAGSASGHLRDVVARRVADAVVLVDVETPTATGTGTGFMVTHDDIVLTSWHVVHDSVAIQVFLGPGRGSAPSQVVAHDEVNDLALLRVLRDDAVPPLQPLALATSTDLRPLQELIVVGNAQVGHGEEPRVITAQVARNQEQDGAHFETDGAIEEGFSGGPLFEIDQGGVVGVVRGGRGRNVKVAVRSERALDLLRSLGYREGDL